MRPERDAENEMAGAKPRPSVIVIFFLDIHSTSNVLNGTFVPDPTDPQAVELFAAQKRFMYAIWESKLKTDMGMSIVRLHAVDRDAQVIWRELSAHQMTSTTGSLAREAILSYLTTVKFDTSAWRGT